MDNLRKIKKENHKLKPRLKPLNALSARQFRKRIVLERAKRRTKVETRVETSHQHTNQTCEKNFAFKTICENINEVNVPLSINTKINIACPPETIGDIESLGDSHIDLIIREEKNVDLQEQLAEWATQHSIKQVALSHLLRILKLHVKDNLVIDARSLLKTPRTSLIKEVSPGEYYHFGLHNGIINFLKQHDHFSSTETSIELMVNIDGLPISKSSNGQLWPILGSIFPYNHVFLIGLYYGKHQKPNDSNDFLFNFIQETKELYNNGIMHNGKKFNFVIKGFSVDAPAKSFMLHIKGHGGYSSCTKCEVEGEYIERRICFLDENIRLRTDLEQRF